MSIPGTQEKVRQGIMSSGLAPQVDNAGKWQG